MKKIVIIVFFMAIAAACAVPEKPTSKFQRGQRVCHVINNAEGIVRHVRHSDFYGWMYTVRFVPPSDMSVSVAVGGSGLLSGGSANAGLFVDTSCDEFELKTCTEEATP